MIPCRALCLVACAALLPLSLAVTACGGGIVTCAGQCSAPYELQVLFKPTTTAQTAHAVMAKCGNNPVVVRVGRLSRREAATPQPLTGALYTRIGYRSRRTLALLHCLTDSGAVSFAAWPG